MVFYAFVKYASTDWSYRYLVTAPDADTMDVWWRKVSDSGNHDDYKRLAPDYFTYTKTNPHQVVPEMTNVMMFTLLHDRDSRILSNFAHQDRTDNISGKTYYIRAKGNPNLYWTEYSNGYIYASDKSRTRFRVTIENDKQGKVMVGDDFIVISSARDSQRQLGVSEGGELHLSGHSCRLRFDDLKNNFLAEVAGEGQDVPVIKANDAGEVWELVS